MLSRVNVQSCKGKREEKKFMKTKEVNVTCIFKVLFSCLLVEIA